MAGRHPGGRVTPFSSTVTPFSSRVNQGIGQKSYRAVCNIISEIQYTDQCRPGEDNIYGSHKGFVLTDIE